MTLVDSIKSKICDNEYLELCNGLKKLYKNPVDESQEYELYKITYLYPRREETDCDCCDYKAVTLTKGHTMAYIKNCYAWSINESNVHYPNDFMDIYIPEFGYEGEWTIDDEEHKLRARLIMAQLVPRPN